MLVMVDETGGVLERGPTVTRPAQVPAGPSTDVPDGAIASACMPGIFPARRLKNNMCVDGGIREVVPTQVAVHDLSRNEVYALRCSAAPALQTRTLRDPLARWWPAASWISPSTRSPTTTSIRMEAGARASR